MADISESQYSREELVADARSLAATLEDAHPDPYAGHGGRVAFHRHLEELVRAIPDDGETVEAFYRRVARFAARVRDGHTRVTAPDSDDGADGRLPLGFRVVGTNLYVDAVYDGAHEDLLGGRLLAVDGVPTAELCERQATVQSADNAYHDRLNLVSALEAVEPLRYLLDEPMTAPMVTVETPDGATADRVLEPVAADAADDTNTDANDPVAELATTVELPETNGEPAYRFLDSDRETALLALSDMFAYREAHEILASLDHASAEEWGRRTYAEIVGDPVPGDHDELVAGFPAATDVLVALVEEMAAAGTETLIVDTRDNGGGTSLLTYVLQYVLYGWEGINEANADHVSVPKDSALYRKSVGEDGPVGETENPAGFDFDDYFERESGYSSDDLPEFVALSPTFAAAAENGDYDGYYRPETVVVVTSASTYSAGTEPAFLLSKLGATVVGVPSAQAPNCPRDVLGDELPNTGLEIGVSYRHVEFCPGEEGDVFTPDVELTPARFEAFDRGGDAGIRLAIAYADDEAPPADRS